MANLSDREFSAGESRSGAFSRRSLLGIGGWLAGAAALLGIEAERARPAAAGAQGEPLEGSWRSEVQREGLPPAVALTTYTSGGGLVSSSNDPLVGTAHGGWVKTDSREYDVTLMRVLRGPDGTDVGTRKARTHLRVDETLDACSITGVIEDSDFGNNLLATRQVSARATRIKAEPTM